LCHATEDKAGIRQLYIWLGENNFDPRLDELDILPGQNWQLEIQKAVRESEIVVVCLSERSITTEGFVQKEVEFALEIAGDKPDGSIFLIPLRLEPREVPYRLKYLQWVDIYTENGHDRL